MKYLIHTSHPQFQLSNEPLWLGEKDIRQEEHLM